VHEGKKEHELALTQLEVVSVDVQLFDNESSHNQLLMKGLLH
jgi:hypothetical protein